MANLSDIVEDVISMEAEQMEAIQNIISKVHVEKRCRLWSCYDNFREITYWLKNL